MGLLYIMPVSEDEIDRVEVIESEGSKLVHVKSYGLPLIFWGYLLAILSVIFIMAIAIKGPLEAVLSGEDQINKILGYIVLSILFITPTALIAFFFYEKVISKSGKDLVITHKVFWLPVWKKNLILKDAQALTLEHFLDSPNMARIQNRDEMKGFANKGYFELFAILENQKLVRIDRSSQRYELTKLKDFLSKF